MVTNIGKSYTSEVVVSAEKCAQSMGSGDLLVFATPAMVALMESAAMLCVAPLLDEGSTTVGSAISTSHLRPSPIGASVRATATLTGVEGRKLSFAIIAEDEKGVIGEGEHTRFVVDRTKFMAKLQ